MNKHLTEEDVIEGIKRKRMDAEAYFYRINKEKCVQYALKSFFWKSPNGNIIKCSAEDAEELYNDACVLFVQNVIRERITQLDAKVSTYLITIMRYAWMNRARARKPAPEKIELPPTENNNEWMRHNVRTAINQLDPKCREMMTYRYILGWEDYEDIAKVTGKENGDVIRNLLSRCRKRFREQYIQAVNISGI
ncbi:MAG: sigma-70 family RNA polymerase sigma factor [Saprospiraceae bacterium]